MGLFDFLKKDKKGDQINVEKDDFDSVLDNAVIEEELKNDEILKIKNIDDIIPEIEDEVLKTKFENINENNDELDIIITEENNTNDIEESALQKSGFFAKILTGLDKTRKNILSNVDNVLKSFTSIDEELYEELEEALIMADIGVETSLMIISQLKEKVKKAKIHDVNEVRTALIEIIKNILVEDSNLFVLNKPAIILVIGVNGVGKTTTIGKLANIYKKQGNKVLVAAADTFRAAAIDQLVVWGNRSGVDVIKNSEGSDPAAVVYDALNAAKARKTDILIIDTAGRLHNKKNLMDELSKISKVINKEFGDAQKEVLLVLDSTTGQNAMQQAKLFKEVTDITGLVLTKLDGTAKGGIIIAIKNELKIPVRFIGIGEKIDDLQEFNAEDFAKALFMEQN